MRMFARLRAEIALNMSMVACSTIGLAACANDLKRPELHGPRAQLLEIVAARNTTDPLQVLIRLSGTVDPAVCVRMFEGGISRRPPDTLSIAAMVSPEESCSAGAVPGQFVHQFLVDSVTTPVIVFRASIWNGRGLTRRLSVPF